jgi:F-type H+-transporting ATPase subunit b
MHLRGRARLGGFLCALALVASLFGAGHAAAPETTPAAGTETTHAAAGEHGGGLISLDKSLIVQAVNFVILLVILQRLLYKPFLAKMEERTSAIKKSLEESQAARAEAARQAEENATRLRQAHAEAAAIREQALKEAGEEQRRLVESARAEAQRLVESAKAQMDADIRRAREELRREAADLATAVAEKLVRRSLRDEDHRRVVADAISRLGN